MVRELDGRLGLTEDAKAPTAVPARDDDAALLEQLLRGCGASAPMLASQER